MKYKIRYKIGKITYVETYSNAFVALLRATKLNNKGIRVHANLNKIKLP